MKILITGATGFVGSHFLQYILKHTQHDPVVSLRSKAKLPSGVQSIVCGSLQPSTNWEEALAGVSVVVHLAARVHITKDTAIDSLAEFRKVNVASTLNLARQAANAGVQRFVFLSSIKVNGEFSQLGVPFTPEDVHIPVDPYGLSKYEAEEGLNDISSKTDMEVTIIRPSLVYGANVKANFLSMMRWLDKGVPLPLGAINNKRSLVAIETLVDLMVTCIEHPAAANQTFMVSDDEDVSTTQLLQRLGEALGKPAKLLPIPQTFLKVTLRLIGQDEIARRLCNSLQVDIKKTRNLLGWQPSISVSTALDKTAQDFLQNRVKKL